MKSHTALPGRGQTNIVRLGWISLLNDLGSEVLTRLVPLFVSGVLGAPMSAVGAIEGLAESTATFLKPIFGGLSDRMGKRKGFIVLGYALSVLARPFLALAGAWPEVAFLRFCDRTGKGVRTAPRDALIAESSPPQGFGKSFGINRALDTFGAVLGIGAFALWTWTHGEASLQASTWIGLTLACSIPGLAALVLAQGGIQDIRPPRRKGALSPTIEPSVPISGTLKRYLFVLACFGLANSSDAFILLQAKALGYTLPAILGMIALLNLVSAMTAIPAAALSDRFGRRTLIAAGWTIYALTYAVLGTETAAAHAWVLVLAIGTYGLFSGFTESVERAWIADLATPEQRGKTYGWFGLITGLTALPASAGFGWVWDQWGSTAAFWMGSSIALFAAGLLFLFLPGQPAQPIRRADRENSVLKG